MKEIWKYTILVEDFLEIKMPVDSMVLTIQVQRGTPCLWVLVNPEAEKETRRFRLAGTGHPIESQHADMYIGTFQLHGGSLVFHLFEIEQEAK